MVTIGRPRIRAVNETERDRYVRRYSDPSKRARIKARNKSAKYRDRYGITLEEADAIKARGCEVCGSRTAKLCVDHCHATGLVRGCLCNDCNVSLGRLREDPERIIRLAEYIRDRKPIPINHNGTC